MDSMHIHDSNYILGICRYPLNSLISLESIDINGIHEYPSNPQASIESAEFMDINEIHSFHGAFDLSNVGKSQSFLMLELTLLSLSGCLVELCESVPGQASPCLASTRLTKVGGCYCPPTGGN